MRARLVLGLVVLALLVYGLWPTDQQAAVRRVPVAAALAFTAGDLLGCLELFEPSYLDTSEGLSLDRDTIRAGVLAGGRRFAVRVDARDVAVDDFDGAAGTARIRFTARLLRVKVAGVSVEDGDPEWIAQITARLRRDEASGWRFVSSEHATLAGKAPYR